MHCFPIPAFDDNLIWLWHDGERAAAVDPGDAEPVLHTLHERDLRLDAVLITHLHDDHTGGAARLRRETGAQVYAPSWDGATQAVRGGTTLSLIGRRVEVLHVPGHTAEHVAFVLPQPGWLFCGDTLFSAGCGRLFGGTPAQMTASLERLAALPPQTQVFAAHEYTLANLRFAAAVEPDNAALHAYAERCRELRGRGQPTLPSTLATELAVNPFLRTRTPTVRAAVAAHVGTMPPNNVAVFAALRRWKDEFQ